MGIKILVATDGSVPADSAERYAVKLAKKLGARVVALYVVEHSEYPLRRLWSRMKHELLHQASVEGEEILEKVKELGEKEGVEVEMVTRKGSPAEEIVRYVYENRDVQLLVIAPRSKGMLYKLFVGSTTEAVVRELGKLVPCPVIITPCEKITPECRMEV